MELEIVARQKNSRIVRTRGVLPKSKKILGGHFVVRMVTATIYTSGYIATITNYFVLIFL